MVQIINEILFTVRNLCETKLRDFAIFLANSQKFGTTKYLIW